MSQFTIYHNPRCSKSRQTLQLLEENGVEPTVVLYLDTPPSKTQLSTILKQLDIKAGELIRRGEEVYKENNLGDSAVTEAQLIEAMVTHPQLIERPIVVKGDKAVLGRPPENVLALL